MSSPRHRAREVALQFLYRHDLEQHAPELTSEEFSEKAIELAGQLKAHFDHFQVMEESRAFAAQLVAGTLSTQVELDALIEKHAANWKLSRMSAIDRNLLRMASFEMLTLKDIPPSVTIDEAIELAKQFGTQESPSFINGILDAIRIDKAPRGL